MTLYIGNTNFFHFPLPTKVFNVASVVVSGNGESFRFTITTAMILFYYS